MRDRARHANFYHSLHPAPFLYTFAGKGFSPERREETQRPQSHATAADIAMRRHESLVSISCWPSLSVVATRAELDAPVVTTLPNGAVEVEHGARRVGRYQRLKPVELYQVGGIDAEGSGGGTGRSAECGARRRGWHLRGRREAGGHQAVRPDGGYVRSFGREGGGPVRPGRVHRRAPGRSRCTIRDQAAPASSIRP